MKDIGRMINSMVKGTKNGRIMLIIEGFMLMVKKKVLFILFFFIYCLKKEKEFLFDLMEAHMKASLKKIILMGMARMYEEIKENMLDIGK